VNVKHYDVLIAAIKSREIKDLAHRLVLQDAFGMASYEQLSAMYTDLSAPDRQTFLWLAFSVCAQVMALDILRWTIGKVVEAEAQSAVAKRWTAKWARLEERDAAISEQEATFATCKKTYWKRLGDERRVNEHLARRLATANASMRDAWMIRDRQARQLNQMRPLLALRDALRDAVAIEG